MPLVQNLNATPLYGLDCFDSYIKTQDRLDTYHAKCKEINYSTYTNTLSKIKTNIATIK